MARTTGVDHVATVTADLDRIVAFYQHVFDARITFEMAATQAHPRMVILDLGGGSALNITEQSAGTIVGDRAPRFSFRFWGLTAWNDRCGLVARILVMSGQRGTQGSTC